MENVALSRDRSELLKILMSPAAKCSNKTIDSAPSGLNKLSEARFYDIKDKNRVKLAKQVELQKKEMVWLNQRKALLSRNSNNNVGLNIRCLPQHTQKELIHFKLNKYVRNHEPQLLDRPNKIYFN